MTPDRFTCAALGVAGALLVACGGKDAPRTDMADSATSAAEAPPPSDSPRAAPADAPGATADPATAPLAPDDIDRWQKGMTAELAAVRDAGTRLRSAKTSEDTLSAMMGMQEMATAAAGAKAAGVGEERYKLIRSSLSAAAGYLAPHIGGVDTTMLSPAQREEMRKGNEAQLKQMEGTVPPTVVEALRPRAAELRKQSLELAGARLKAAGA